MTAKIKDVGTRIMNEHGIYPLLDTLTNDALLQTVCRDDRNAEQADIYVDAKGLHLVWRPVKRDRNGHAIWNGGNLLLDTKSADVTEESAAKLDYDGEAPDFSNTSKADNDETWFITSPEVKDGYMFALCGLKDDDGTHVTHVFATDGKHARLLLSADSSAGMAAFEHTGTSRSIRPLTRDDITMIDTDADILSKAKELLK